MTDNRSKFTEFFMGTPAYNEDKDYANFASLTAPLNMFFLICVVLHTAYLIVFSIYKVTPLVLFDIVCVALYAAFVIILKYFKGSWFPCTLITIMELFLHQICCVAFFGLDPGFHFLLIPLMFLSVFISNKGEVVNLARGPILLPPEISKGLLIVNCGLSLFVSTIYAGRVVNSIDSKRSKLDESVDEKIAAIERMQHQIIISFSNIIEARDGNTGKHVKRTSEYVEALVKELARTGAYSDILTERYMHDTIISAPLHDIGKITVPDAILLKPGKLTDEEFNAIKN